VAIIILVTAVPCYGEVGPGVLQEEATGLGVGGGGRRRRRRRGGRRRGDGREEDTI